MTGPLGSPVSTRGHPEAPESGRIRIANFRLPPGWIPIGMTTNRHDWNLENRLCLHQQLVPRQARGAGLSWIHQTTLAVVLHPHFVVMSRPRAFISYSHENRSVFEKLIPMLEAQGLEPRSDCNLNPGMGFTEQIKLSIAHSHVFLPLLTPESHSRGWVHQEIGYAVAMKVPVVPICIGKLPDGMIQVLQAIVSSDAADELLGKLNKVRFAELVSEAGLHWQPSSECAAEVEDRAVLFQRYSNDARKFMGPQCVRQAGGFTSFSIPDESTGHFSWKARFGQKLPGPHTLGLLRRERQSLEEHARAAGCKLIVNLGHDHAHLYPGGSRHARCSILLSFLESLPATPLLGQVVLLERYQPYSLTAVGDWFFSESRAPTFGKGFQHTFFMAHAPTVSRLVREFDQEFEGLLAAQGISARESLEWAIEKLRTEIGNLEPDPSWPVKQTRL